MSSGCSLSVVLLIMVVILVLLRHLAIGSLLLLAHDIDASPDGTRAAADGQDDPQTGHLDAALITSVHASNGWVD